MNAYAKALIPLIAGIVLVVLGVLLGDDPLRQIGYGALLASPIVYAVPNRENAKRR